MKTLFFLIIFSALSLTLIQNQTYAQNPIGLNRTKQPGGIVVTTPGNSAKTLGDIVKNLITLFYTLGALGFTIMVIWGAVDWILSGGDKEKVAGARKRITTALVGLFLLALSFPIIGIIAQISGIDIFGNLPLKNLTAP